MKYCPACGTPNDDSAAFCKKCGSKYRVEPSDSATPSDGSGELNQGSYDQQTTGEQAPGAPPTPEAQQPPVPGAKVPLPPVPPPPGMPQPPPYPPPGLAGGWPRGFGVQPGAPVQARGYAGFWIRFVAILIDAFIVGFVFLGPFRLYVNGRPEIVGVAVAIIYTIAYFAYFILMTGWRGQTLGKMALRLKVVNQDMTDIDYGVSTAREFSKILSAIILYIGFIMAGFDSHKRALHDRIASTYVIKY